MDRLHFVVRVFEIVRTYEDIWLEPEARHRQVVKLMHRLADDLGLAPDP